ncbi:hypothetical protein [Syntrophomonas erecta]
MIRDDRRTKKVYDETATLITRLGITHQLEPREMEFLLNLLDEVIVKRDNPTLVRLLKKWTMQKDIPPETDEIIRATVLATDWNDPDSVMSSAELIRDLLASR